MYVLRRHYGSYSRLIINAQLQQRPKKRQRLGEASASDQATINAPFRFPSPPATATIETAPRPSRSLSPSLPTNLTLLKPAGQAIIVDGKVSSVAFLDTAYSFVEEKRHNKTMPTSHRLDVPSTSRAPSPQAPAVIPSSTCTVSYTCMIIRTAC